jgi:hypothetical protein
MADELFEEAIARHWAATTSSWRRPAVSERERLAAVSSTTEDNEFRCEVMLAEDPGRTADLHVFFIPTPAPS